MARQSSDAGLRRPAILLTRPAAASARFATAVTNRFGAKVETILSPLMQAVFHQPALPPVAFDAVIFTSEAGVEGARRLKTTGVPLPSRAYCVGDLTARAATSAGFKAVSAKGDASTLLALIQSAASAGPLLYLHGRDTRGGLAERLNLAGLVTHSALVYQQDPVPLTAKATTRLRQAEPVLIPLFSPRSADLLAAALPAGTAPLYLAAISAAVADRASRTPHRALHIAVRPDGEAMLDTLQELIILAQPS